MWTKSGQVYTPRWNDELKDLVRDLSIPLASIDVSQVEEFQGVFKGVKRTDWDGIVNWNVVHGFDFDYMFFMSNIGNVNLSRWDVSGARSMEGMFAQTSFNGDISAWDVHNVGNMHLMFAVSRFNGNISKWDVSRVRDMSYMFYKSSFNRDISKWDVSSVKDMDGMFEDSRFSKDISNWNVGLSDKVRGRDTFKGSPLQVDPPLWYNAKPPSWYING